MRVHHHMNEPDDRGRDGLRGWATVYGRDEQEIGSGHFQLTTKWHGGAGLTFGVGADEADLSLTLRGPRAFAHVSVSVRPLGRLLRLALRPGRLGYDGRDTGITWDHGTLRLRLFASDYGSTSELRLPNAWFNRNRSRRRKMRPMTGGVQLLSGVELSVCPVDVILGRRECQTTVGKFAPVTVPMPEGNYPGMVRPERRVWRRKRWPFVVAERSSYDLEMSVPIPLPGKGENSWDCGDDALHATGGGTIAEAVGNAVEHVTGRRDRYGAGADYVPADGWPAALTSRANGGPS